MKKTAKLTIETTTGVSGYITLVASNGKEVMRSEDYASVFNTKRAKGDIINAMVEALRREGYSVTEGIIPRTMTAG